MPSAWWADGEIDLDVARADRDGANESAGDDGAGEAGLVPVEVVLVAGLAVGEGDGVGCTLRAAGKNLHALRHADVHLGGEAVGHVAGAGKPARGIEQVSDGLLDGGQLQSFNGAVFAAGDGAVVFKCPASWLAGDERRMPA